MRLMQFSVAVLFFLFHCFVIATTTSDLSTDRAALLALRSAVGGRTLLWNVSEMTPCNWDGVRCSKGSNCHGVRCSKNRVIGLRLPSSSLLGALPLNTIGNITRIRTLALPFNNLSGPLPADLSQCAELKNLYLQGNQFSGSMSTILRLHSLAHLNLAGNKFSGEISPGINNMIYLRKLYLERNNISGPIPELRLPLLVELNVSFNILNGSIPKGLEGLPVSAFSGNMLCGEPLAICHNNETLYDALGNVSFIVLVVVVLYWVFLWFLKFLEYIDGAIEGAIKTRRKRDRTARRGGNARSHVD